MSIALAKFANLFFGYPILLMKTIAETRRMRLDMLVKRHGDSLAKLNEVLGLDRTDATLSQIRTQAKHSKTGKPRSMGDDLARRIENTLLLERGWMDTPPTLSEQYGRPDTKAMVMEVMDKLPHEHHATVLRLVNALVEPAFKSKWHGNINEYSISKI